MFETEIFNGKVEAFHGLLWFHNACIKIMNNEHIFHLMPLEHNLCHLVWPKKGFKNGPLWYWAFFQWYFHIPLACPWQYTHWVLHGYFSSAYIDQCKKGLFAALQRWSLVVASYKSYCAHPLLLQVQFTRRPFFLVGSTCVVSKYLWHYCYF